jgi:hypothetical protein
MKKSYFGSFHYKNYFNKDVNSQSGDKFIEKLPWCNAKCLGNFRKWRIITICFTIMITT